MLQYKVHKNSLGDTYHHLETLEKKIFNPNKFNDLLSLIIDAYPSEPACVKHIVSFLLLLTKTHTPTQQKETLLKFWKFLYNSYVAPFFNTQAEQPETEKEAPADKQSKKHRKKEKRLTE